MANTPTMHPTSPWTPGLTLVLAFLSAVAFAVWVGMTHAGGHPVQSEQELAHFRDRYGPEPLH